MSDEQERQEQQQNSPPAPEKESNSWDWGTNERGDLLIDGTVVEKNPHGVLFGPEGDAEGAPPAAANADEMAEIRRERDELRTQFEQGEPWLRLADKPVLKQILDEYISRGEAEAPAGPMHSVEDSAGYRLRVAEPDAEAVMDTMRLHVSTLPEYEARVIDSNPRAFNDLYDRVKATLGDRVNTIRPRPPVLPAAYGPNIPMDRRQIEASIRSKEVSRARVEPPGNLPDYPSTDEDGQRTRAQEYGRAKERFAKARQFGNPTQVADAEVKMIEAYFAEPAPKRGGVSGY